MIFSLEEIWADLIKTLLQSASALTDLVGIVLIFTLPANRWFKQA